MFEEDLHGNLRLCIEMAPSHCHDCGDFHISVAVRRASEKTSAVGMDFDAEAFVELVAKSIASDHALGTGPTVLIAGAADTAILKLVIEAAVRAGGAALASRLRITVVDLCETPLEMCRRFAARHGLMLDTARADIGSFVPADHFGTIVMHGVIPFFPADQRVAYVRRISGWLAAGGAIVSASQLEETGEGKQAALHTAERLAALDEFLEAEGMMESVDAEGLRDRVRRAILIRRSYKPLFTTEADLVDFYGQAGLKLVETRVIDLAGANLAKRYSKRAVVLARRGGD